jgi:hypothetical protein
MDGMDGTDGWMISVNLGRCRVCRALCSVRVGGWMSELQSESGRYSLGMRV